MEGELQIFTNGEFGEVRTALVNNEVWFVGKDVAASLGYKNTKDALIKHVDGEDKDIAKIHTNGGIQKLTIINAKGLQNLIMKCRTLSESQKERFIQEFKNIGFIQENVIVVNSRKEINFFDKLKETLKPLDIDLVQQYSVLSYRLDGYIKELNIAIEYDENDHSDYSYEAQELRQKRVEKELGSRFVRLSDKNTDEYNIGLVIKEVFNKKINVEVF